MIEEIYQQFQQQLLKFITAKVGDIAIAEDILQEVFIQVVKRISHLEDQTKLTPWLYQICRNKIIDYYRVKKLSTVSLENSESHDFIAEAEPYQGMEQIEDCVGVLIANLPNNFSRILLNSEIQAVKYKDIASAEKLSVSAVKSRVRRGRMLLKKQLEACCAIDFKEEGVTSDCQHQCGSAQL